MAIVNIQGARYEEGTKIMGSEKTYRMVNIGRRFYGAQLVPPNFSHQVSFSRRQFSLARLFFFFGTTFFLA